ncbi:MAG: 50S ribosomal protein L9 [Crocinitomicaceae bacterium]|nr:50S ribosomal protein L9 [Crocinitomicaceae bacterium]|tara:strand:- start:41955 stop:42401 length:447 start_codon:yes stop_codon:yes gene_type:complete
MDIILKKNVDGLGEVDDLVTVKSGYGRNYLIPSGNAILATVSAKKIREENLRQRSHKIEKVREEAKAAAEKLAAITVKIGAKVGENGKIFGSITNLQVADAIKALGFEVERKNIAIVNEPIKQVGTYEAKVKFQKGVETTINFEVIEE